MLILPISIQHVASVALARRIVRDIVGLSKAEVASYCWRGISSSVNKPVIHPFCHFIIIVCVFFFCLPVLQTFEFGSTITYDYYILFHES